MQEGHSAGPVVVDGRGPGGTMAGEGGRSGQAGADAGRANG